MNGTQISLIAAGVLYLTVGIARAQPDQGAPPSGEKETTSDDAWLDELQADQPAAESTPESTPQQGPATEPTTSPDPESKTADAAAAPADEAKEPDPATAHRRGSSLIEEIVVTAQKREEAINDVPIAINAYSGQALKELGIEDTRDLGNLVPGFSYADSGNNAPIYQLRGVGFNEKSQTASSTVGVYVDEFNFPFPVLTKGANLDLERVEVLKGPQGTLYGRNTTGGAVNYIANKPTEEFETGGSMSVARFLTTDVEGFISGPLGDTLGVRFAVRDVRSQEGWQHSVTRYGDGSNDSRNPPPAPPGTYDVLGRKDNQAARLKVQWEPQDTLALNFAVDWWQDNGDSQAGQVIGLHPKNPQFVHPDVSGYPTLTPDNRDSQLADWPVDTPRPWKLDDTFLMGSVRSDWDLSEAMTLTFLGQHITFSGDDALPWSGFDTPNLDAYVTTDTKVSAGELRLAGVTGDFNWLTGVYLSRDEASEVEDVHIETDSAAFNNGQSTPVADWAMTFGVQTSDVAAAFGSTNWQFAETLRLTLGARYTTEERNYRGCVRDSPNRTQGVGFFTVFNGISTSGGGSDGIQDGECVTLDAETSDPVPPDGARGVLDEANVSGRIALDWVPSDGLLFYASYGRGFKSGSFPVLPASTTDQYEPATQEQLNAYEVGSKTDLLDGLVQLNTAAYFYDYKDKQLVGSVTDQVFGELPRLINAPESRVYGAEFDLSSNPFSTLFLSAAFAYVNTKVIEFTGLSEFGTVENFAGRPFNYAPEIEYSLVANYVYGLSDQLDLTFGADYSWSDESNASLAGIPEFALPSYQIVNARMALGSVAGTWKLMAWGRNLTDSMVANNVLILGDAIARRTSMPMTYGFTLERRFP